MIIWRTGPGALYRKASNLAGTDQLLSSELGQSPSSVSPDDKTLLVVKGGIDIWSLPLGAEPSQNSTARAILASSSGEHHAQFSPDGRWMAYTSDESKTREAYVMAFPGPGGKWQVSSGGASHVRCPRRDGRELFYLTRGGDLMAAEITVRGDTLEVGLAQRLFGGIFTIESGQGYSYDVALEGTSTRFIVAEGVERRNAAQESLTLVENWTGLLTTVP